MKTTFYLLILLLGYNCYAGVDFSGKAMVVNLVDGEWAKITEQPIKADLEVCVAIVIRGKGMIHLLPLRVHTTDYLIRKFMREIRYEPTDEVYIVFSNFHDYNQYRLTPDYLRTIFPQAIMTGYGLNRTVYASLSSLFYQENGKDTVLYGNGASTHSYSRVATNTDIGELAFGR